MPALMTVTVRLDRRSSPLSGTVSKNGKPTCSFVGWVGLLVALEAAFGTDQLNGGTSAPNAECVTTVGAESG
jgi:hypothetical protein